jgi:hypothetical protein
MATAVLSGRQRQDREHQLAFARRETSPPDLTVWPDIAIRHFVIVDKGEPAQACGDALLHSHPGFGHGAGEDVGAPLRRLSHRGA